MRKESPSFIDYSSCARLLLGVLLLLQVNGIVFGQGGGTFRIDTDTLPAGTVGTAYSQTFKSAGTSTSPYTWSLASGSLPLGLTLTPGGVLTGNPTTAGTFNFTVRVVDSSSPQKTVQKAFTLVINPLINPLSLTTNSPLPAGTVGTPYTQTFTATGGITPYTWSRESGSLPGGLTFTAGGTLSGTPTVAGSFSFTIRVRDNGAVRSDEKAFTLTINPPIPPIAISTGSPLPSGAVGTSYSRTLAATGGTPPYTWSLASGSLPAGLSLSSSGILSGTPTAEGSFNFTIRVTDGGTPQQNAQKAFSLAIISALSITTNSTLPSGSLGTPYSQTLAATGGTPPYTWSLASGSLPAGLSLASSGILSGTPTAAGSFNFTIRVTDGGTPQQNAQKAFSLAIVSALSITTNSTLPSGSLGTPYSQTLAATGGTPPYTWSLASGSLPAGLSLSSSGILSGTPSAAGSFNFTIRVTDGGTPQQNAQKAFSLTITSGLSVTTNSTLPSGFVGTPYSQTLAATGGTPPYTWALTAGSLPGGVNLSASGTLSGTPIAEGSFNFTIRVTDGGTPQQNAQKAFSLAIVSGLSVTTNSTLPSGFVGTPYSETLAATGGTPPYTWALTAGSLPEGVNLSASGTLSGTPTAEGSFNFTIRATDSGTSQQAVPKIFNLTIVSGLSITTSSTLSSGIVGTPYSQTLTATGGTPPYTWSLASDSLPGGVSLSSGGTLVGTPTAAGSFNFTIRATDSSTPQQNVQKAFNLTITSALSITTNSPLPSGIVGTSYSQTLTVTGGTPPLTWSLASGSLPAGLSLSSGGILSGAPTAAGSFSFTIRVTDTAPPQNAQKAFTLTIVPVGTPLSITTTSPLPSGIMGTLYSRDFQASGGTPPYRWSIRSGLPPQGLTLSSDGLLSGTPTTGGSFSFTIRVTDSSSSQQTADQTFILTIDTPTVSSLTLMSVPGELNPTQQQSIALGLSAPYPAALSGILTVSFTPNAVVAIDDPMVMFSTGSRTVSFSIPANSAVAVFPSPVLLLTGTVAGSISLTATLQGSQPQRIATVTVRSLPPQLRNVVGVRTQGGLRVEVTGYSPERRVQRVDFEFRLRTAAGTESASLGRSVEPEFDNWYRSPNSAAFGSSFLFMQSFVVQGDTTAIESVTITLTNAQGSTSSSVISFSN